MAKIEKNMIEALLARPTSKQVLAFEGVFLEDLNDYVKWAIDSLHNSLGEEMDEALLLLSSHFGEPSINYFELKDDLRAFASAARIIPPKGKDAVRLYCLGCLQDVVCGLKRGVESEKDMLQHLSDLLGNYTGVDEFGLIPEMEYHWWHLQQGESHDDIVRDFCREAERLVHLLHVKLHREGEYWKITVE